MQNLKNSRGQQFCAVLLRACCTAVLVSCLGCDSFVGVELPDSQLSVSDVFEDATTANAAMAGVYSKMRDSGMLSGSSTGCSYVLGLYGDELEFYGSSDVDGFLYAANGLLATSPQAASLWNEAYRQIYGANAVINGVGESAFLPEAERNLLMGEALFARGMLHFYLANLFGAIPYVTTTDYQANSTIGKMPVGEAWQQARVDLEEAVSLLPETYRSPDRTRPNKFAAMALLSRICLYQGSWESASEHATAVIESPMYNFDQNIEATFLIGSSATLFQFSPARSTDNTLEAVTFIFDASPGDSALRDELVSTFEQGDLRRANWIRAVEDNGTTYYHAYKYRQGVGATVQAEYSKVLRFSELFLIRSEARARQGDLAGAAADINAVRSQAGLAGTPASSQSELLQAVLQERRVELFAEFGHRFFDLKRLGLLDATLGPVKNGWNTADANFPIPLSELLLNPNLMPQNAGY